MFPVGRLELMVSTYQTVSKSAVGQVIYSKHKTGHFFLNLAKDRIDGAGSGGNCVKLVSENITIMLSNLLL